MNTAKNSLKATLSEMRQSEEYVAEFTIVQFTEELCRVMAEKGISQTVLAALVGRSETYISRVLNGNANFTVKTMSILAEALKMNLHVHLAPKNVWVSFQEVLTGTDIEATIHSLNTEQSFTVTDAQAENSKTDKSFCVGVV